MRYTIAVLLLAMLAAYNVCVAQPTPVAPGSTDGRSLLANACPSFHWTAVPGAERYELVVYAELDTNPIQGSKEPGPILSHAVPGGATSWAPALDQCFEGGKRYAWSIRAITEESLSGWSGAALFTVVTVADDSLTRGDRIAPERPGSIEAEGDPLESRSPEPKGALVPVDASIARPRLRYAGELLRQRSTSPEKIGAPELGDASLALDAQLHLGEDSQIFKAAEPFLWDDTDNQVLALGRRALRSNTVGFVNTAVGDVALYANTTGYFNTGVGGLALAYNEEGSRNTALGAFTLLQNQGDRNTAVGEAALFANTSGSQNTAIGENTLTSNTIASFNTGIGQSALYRNTTGSYNTAVGQDTLRSNTIGVENTAIGQRALESNVGSHNTAVGQAALRFSTATSSNTAIGENALINTTGSNNIALGRLAGAEARSGEDNIFIANEGVTDDDKTIRIGVQGLQLRTRIAGIAGISLGGANVVVESDGRLGVSGSSQRFKEDIRDMESVSGKLSKLRPVRFRYKAETSDAQSDHLEYGLIAEEVAEIVPELVATDSDGNPYAVRYDLLSALLLEELQNQREEMNRLRKEVSQLGKRDSYRTLP